MMNNDTEKNLKFIKEKISKDSLDHAELIGLYCIMLHSKVFFAKNKEVGEFIEATLCLILPNYIIKSRSAMVAKAVKIIFLLNEKDQKKLIKDMRKFLSHQLDFKKNMEPVTHSVAKKKNENDKLVTWLEGL